VGYGSRWFGLSVNHGLSRRLTAGRTQDIVGIDPDPVNRPTIPSCLVPPNANKIPNSTSQLNIHFGLLKDYTDGQLILCCDRYGCGEDNIFLDGQLIAKTPGADKGKLKQSQIPLPSIRQGKDSKRVLRKAENLPNQKRSLRWST
jgi:hypothetical protein